jgi:5,5'-dehydrodivanillate O-demethylase oxygenase subunit
MALAKPLTLADLEAVGPGTPAGRYLRRFWHPVIRARDLLAGRAKPIEVLSEKFTAYRGEDSTAHVVAFRCAHRGTQMSLGWVEGDDLRCRYHGWKYDASGQCIEQPNEDKPFCQRVKMPSYPTQEYAGLVFAYLGEGEPPKFPRYPDLDLPGVIIADPVEVLPCTFWNKIDNDMGHVPWVHRASAYRLGRKDALVLPREMSVETSYGVKSTTAVGRGEAKEFVNYESFHRFIMPNIRQWWPRSRAKGFEGRNLQETKTVWTVPINDQAFMSFDVTHTPMSGEEAHAYAAIRKEVQEAEAETRWDLAKAMLAGEMTPEDLPQDMSGYTSYPIEDYITQVGQGPIADRGREQLGQTDIRPLLTRRLWLREVTAMLEDQPLTEWQIPPETHGMATS